MTRSYSFLTVHYAQRSTRPVLFISYSFGGIVIREVQKSGRVLLIIPDRSVSRVLRTTAQPNVSVAQSVSALVVRRSQLNLFRSLNAVLKAAYDSDSTHEDTESFMMARELPYFRLNVEAETWKLPLSVGNTEEERAIAVRGRSKPPPS